MAINIKHRFINRLSPHSDDFDIINTVVIGTFNPGLPDKSTLTPFEQEQFHSIEKSDKFQKFNSVMNFYDRGANRFWGVMDRIYNPEFYSVYGFEAQNFNGLKAFTRSDKAATFKRQQSFCMKTGLSLTDLVKEICPVTFDSIYNNFPDTQIEKSNPVWNTTEIINTIRQFNPKKVLINFRPENNAIPKIAGQALLVKNSFPKITFSVLSTSGIAANRYRPLLDDWRKHIYFNEGTRAI